MRGKQVRQICYALDAMAASGGTTIRELEEKLGISRRSVERLLANMQEMAFPIYDDQPDGCREKRWHIHEDYVLKLPNTTIPNLTISYHEMLCLYLLNRDDPVFRGTILERHLTSVFSKLSFFFPDEFTDALNRMRNLKVSKPLIRKNYAEHQQTLTGLTESILSQETIHLTYHSFSADEVRTITLNPLHLFEDDGGLYLIAEKTGTNAFRTFAVERIQRIRSADALFDYPSDFDPEAYLGKTFGIIDDGEISVRIRFAGSQARYAAERIWAEGQSVIRKPDGTVDLLFTTRGIRDVKKWVMGWGMDAEVLEPEWLRDELREIFRGLVKKYG